MGRSGVRSGFINAPISSESDEMRVSDFSLRLTGSMRRAALSLPVEAGMWRSSSASRHPLAAGREG
jgi:hypothetical protein